jgi:hypothetical protein
MIYEAEVACPWVDNYDQHRFVEQIFKGSNGQCGAAPRTYTWAYIPGQHSVIVRHAIPIQPRTYNWLPLHPPPAGTTVQFRFLANVRDWNGRALRTTSLDEQRNREWLDYASTKMIGWELDRYSVDLDFVSIEVRPLAKGSGRRVQNRRHRDEFILNTTLFSGRATIVDPEKFTHVLLHGLGNAKAFGVGFIFYVSVRK